jgi:hypothetical protein
MDKQSGKSLDAYSHGSQPITHQFLVLQVFIGQGPSDSFQVEVQIRDKQNVSLNFI